MENAELSYLCVMKYFQSPPTTTLFIAMIFFGYAIHCYAMYSEMSWVAISIGSLILLAGFAYSFWQYKQWQDDE